MQSACHQVAGWSPQRTEGQSPLLGYGHSTESTARPALGVEFSIAKLMLIPSLSPGLLCSWVTEQRQRWLSRMLIDIHSRGCLSHLIAKVPLFFFVCFVFFLLIHMEHKYLPILFPKTSIYIPSSGLFFHESYNCAPNHSTKPLATFHELVSSWSFDISLIGKNKQAITQTEALPFTEKQVPMPNLQEG